MQAEPSYRLKPQDLDQIYVRSKNTNMVPLKAMVTTKYVTGPDLITRFNNYPAVKITVNAAPGYSSGQAMGALEDIAAQLPSTYGIGWSGEAYEAQKSGG